MWRTNRVQIVGWRPITGMSPGALYEVPWKSWDRIWHKADMLNALTNVRFWGQSGH